MERNAIIPVVNFHHLNQVETVMSGLVDQGIQCIEITLRSALAMDALKLAVSLRRGQFKVGVGSLMSPEQVDAAVRAGVDFLVSPGLTPELADALAQSQVPFLPGVMTPSEILSAKARGWNTFKLFPFNVAGGFNALKAYSALFPDVRFCPTGGVDQENYKSVLESPNVISVGGSWVAAPFLNATPR